MRDPVFNSIIERLSDDAERACMKRMLEAKRFEIVTLIGLLVL